ncbi:hypothetical protein QQ056_16870 [Oscillatoria laete-virens NRMC-F 0139]|nr:hypothetical protein [Oscillatoria laete-virens]MDL5055206.1 hypothetical protein [Oscillatoria laete-virens NRMC-F 0139]
MQLPYHEHLSVNLPVHFDSPELNSDFLRLDVFVDKELRMIPPDIMRPRVLMAATDREIHMIFDWMDGGKEGIQSDKMSPWEAEGIEIFLMFPVEHKRHIQFILNPFTHPNVHTQIHAYDHTWQGRELKSEGETCRIEGGSQIHFRVPWSQFSEKPSVGDAIGVQITFKTIDSDGQLRMASLYPQAHTWSFPICSQKMILSNQASTPYQRGAWSIEEKAFMRRFSSEFSFPVWYQTNQVNPTSRFKLVSMTPYSHVELYENKRLIIQYHITDECLKQELEIFLPDSKKQYDLIVDGEKIASHTPLVKKHFKKTTGGIDWFQQSGWGVLMHFLCPVGTSAVEWNQQVDDFDCEGLSAQLSSVGAGYFFLTIGQRSGHWCAPNPVYDEIVKISPSRCSRRDLIHDMAKALKKYGIRLCVYAPADGGWGDPETRGALAWEDHWTAGWLSKQKELRLEKFQRNWEKIMAYWSKKWGHDVNAWWVDGCHFYESMYEHVDEPNFSSFARALKSGNSSALVSFSAGTMPLLANITDENDYIAGEAGDEHPVCPGPTIHGIQSHVLSYLGANWMSGPPRFSDGFVREYTRHWIERGGVLTWDVPHHTNGLIPVEFLSQLHSIRS